MQHNGQGRHGWMCQWCCPGQQGTAGAWTQLATSQLASRASTKQWGVIFSTVTVASTALVLTALAEKESRKGVLQEHINEDSLHPVQATDDCIRCFVMNRTSSRGGCFKRCAVVISSLLSTWRWGSERQHCIAPSDPR